MKTPKMTLLAAGLGLALAACSGDPMKAPLDAMRAGDLAQAESLLDTLAQKKPKLLPMHAARFVLFRHLSVHGPGDKQPAYLTKAIAEYDTLALALGLKADYGDMEGSLRSNPEGAAALAAARKTIYGE